MKKLLLIAAATTALSASAFAEATEGTVYLRLDASANKFQGFSDKAVKTKLKTKWNAGIDAGVGYYVMDNVRVEGVYTHPFNVEPKKNDSPATGVNRTTKHKAEIHALFAKAAVDVADMGMAQLYVDGGIGWSHLKEKISITTTDRRDTPASASTKKANQFAWTVGAGAAGDLADGVKADLQYAYTDFGKTKGKTSGNSKEYGKSRYRSHSVKLGVRFAI